MTLPVFKASQCIACYLPIADEFDTTAIIEAIWQAKKNCYLPVLCDEKYNYLQFVKYDNGNALRRNKYKILEPFDTSKKIPAQELDLVITPLLAFDLHGDRLGAGGGYYDRTFAFLHDEDLKNKKTPFMLGLGFATQQSESLPKEEWDVKLNGVLTEKNGVIF